MLYIFWGSNLDDLTIFLQFQTKNKKNNLPYSLGHSPKCVVHQIRNSCKHTVYKDKKEFTEDMKNIYNPLSGCNHAT